MCDEKEAENTSIAKLIGSAVGPNVEPIFVVAPHLDNEHLKILQAIGCIDREEFEVIPVAQCVTATPSDNNDEKLRELLGLVGKHLPIGLLPMGPLVEHAKRVNLEMPYGNGPAGLSTADLSALNISQNIDAFPTPILGNWPIDCEPSNVTVKKPQPHPAEHYSPIHYHIKRDGQMLCGLKTAYSYLKWTEAIAFEQTEHKKLCPKCAKIFYERLDRLKNPVIVPTKKKSGK